MASVTTKDLELTFDQYATFMQDNHLVSPGFELVLQKGGAGLSWRVYETPADNPGSKLFPPMVGDNFLGVTRVESDRILRDRLNTLDAALNPTRKPNELELAEA